jgi:hypothetical protein
LGWRPANVSQARLFLGTGPCFVFVEKISLRCGHCICPDDFVRLGGKVGQDAMMFHKQALELELYMYLQSREEAFCRRQERHRERSMERRQRDHRELQRTSSSTHNQGVEGGGEGSGSAGDASP